MFDIFLSFRGEDTRYSFTDHLYAALKRAAIHTFRDDDEIRRGQDLKPEISKAIQNSRASIVVLSENYAKSTWCLEELWLILELKRKSNHFVLPVFYKIDPSDVRNQRKSFAIEASDGVEGSKWTQVNVNRWKLALTEVANLTGMVASGPETELIENIVDTVDYELDLKLVSTPAHLTGMESRAKDINSWLKNEHSDTNVLAICGMGGGGKTTLAQCIYNAHKHDFESSCFLEEIGKHSKQNYGMLELQKQLLTGILGGKNKMISCVSEGTTKIKEALRLKKVLIVLDDIDEHDELDALLGTSVIHTQSKLIITTRLLDIHSWFESISWTCIVHKLSLLNDNESLEVLSRHAFGSKFPLEGFSDLAVALARHCGGNPLALKVLGSSLFVSAKDLREKNSIIEIWRSRLNSLSSSKGDLDSKIQSVLRKSFDSLPLTSYKELFLDIAVFFVGEDEDYVVNILEHDWHAKAGIMTLINRCLLAISPNKKLVMHQLLQAMGRNIVDEDSKYPTKHTRVWCSDEAYHALTGGVGLEAIEGLALDTRKLKKGTKALTIKTSSLVKLHKLKLFQMKYVKFSGHHMNLPELRWLRWHGCHLRAIPSGLLKSNFLVAIDITGGNLQVFEPPMVLNSMKILSLSDCYQLRSICKLYRLPNLETLNLWRCRKLAHVCKSIEGLKNLAILNLAECEKLSETLWSKKHVHPLERLHAFCIHELPQPLKLSILLLRGYEYEIDDVSGFTRKLFGLILSYNSHKFMPENIDLKTLRILNLNFCKNLKSLPCLPSTLEELYTYGCQSLEKVTFQSTRFRLKKFTYKGCFKLCEVQGLFKLVAIEELDEADLGHMKWVKAFEDQKVDLVGDEITEGKIWHIQMLHEYGIRSTYLQGINDQSMMAFEYTSVHHFLTFNVPSHPKIHRIQGLNVSCLYRLSEPTDNDRWCLFIEIRNITKGVTWIYNPLVYSKPRVDEDATWLSYWPIGNNLDPNDEIYVCIMVGEGMRASKCGASFVYKDDDDDLKMESGMEEVIGGDLSEFELTTGFYYLCRRDFFKSATPEMITKNFGDKIPYTELLEGWRKSYQSGDSDSSCMEEEDFEEQVKFKDNLYKRILLGNFNSESDFPKIKEAVCRLVGCEDVYCDTDKNMMCIFGSVDCMAVETCVREFQKTVKVLHVDYKVTPPPEFSAGLIMVLVVHVLPLIFTSVVTLTFFLKFLLCVVTKPYGIVDGESPADIFRKVRCTEGNVRVLLGRAVHVLLTILTAYICIVFYVQKIPRLYCKPKVDKDAMWLSH